MVTFTPARRVSDGRVEDGYISDGDNGARPGRFYTEAQRQAAVSQMRPPAGPPSYEHVRATQNYSRPFNRASVAAMQAAAGPEAPPPYAGMQEGALHFAFGGHTTGNEIVALLQHDEQVMRRLQLQPELLQMIMQIPDTVQLLRRGDIGSQLFHQILDRFQAVLGPDDAQSLQASRSS